MEHNLVPKRLNFIHKPMYTVSIMVNHQPGPIARPQPTIAQQSSMPRHISMQEPHFGWIDVRSMRSSARAGDSRVHQLLLRVAYALAGRSCALLLHASWSALAFAILNHALSEHHQIKRLRFLSTSPQRRRQRLLGHAHRQRSAARGLLARRLNYERVRVRRWRRRGRELDGWSMEVRSLGLCG